MDSLQRLAVCWQRMNLCRYVLRRWSGRLCLMWVFLRRQNALFLCLRLLATAVRCFTIPLCIAVCLSRKVIRAVVLPRVCPLPELMLSRRRIPPSQGLYLTSSAVLQSYGGGAESGMYASSGSHSAVSSVSPSSAGVSLGAMSVSPVAYSPSYSSAFSSVALVYASADQTLSARKGAQRRKNGVTIEDTYYQWLQSNSWAFGAGADNLSESQVRALWDALCANNEDFALTYTYEEFYNWFLSKQSDETFKWKLPVGEGVPCLLLLCVGYVIVKYKQQKNQWI